MGFFGNHDPRVPIHVTKKEDVPKQEHWAIFKFSSITYSLYSDNDSSETIIRYEAYLDRNAWVAEIENLEKNKKSYDKPYVACIIKPKEPRVTVSVDVDV